MNSIVKNIANKIALLFFVSLIMAKAHAQVVMENPSQLKGIDVEEHLGASLPKDLEFTNEYGKTVKLGDYLDGKRPVLLTLAYYRCPMLCGLMLNGVCNSAKALDLVPAKDYQILTVSIDPRETAELAMAKKTRYVEQFGKAGIEQGWSFLVGSGENTKALADAVGFKYFYDAKRDEYAHPAVSYLISPEGKIVRYLYGMDYKRFDLKMGLIEASQGKVGTTIDRIILSCFHYDAKEGSYVLFAQNLMRLGGFLIVVVLAIVVWRLFAQERKKHVLKGEPSSDIHLN
jgi:protein SCO1/2